MKHIASFLFGSKSLKHASSVHNPYEHLSVHNPYEQLSVHNPNEQLSVHNPYELDLLWLVRALFLNFRTKNFFCADWDWQEKAAAAILLAKC